VHTRLQRLAAAQLHRPLMAAETHMMTQARCDNPVRPRARPPAAAAAPARSDLLATQAALRHAGAGVGWKVPAALVSWTAAAMRALPARAARAAARRKPHEAARAQTAGIMQRLRELAAEVHARYVRRHPAQPPQPGTEAAGGAGGKRRKRAPRPSEGPAPLYLSVHACIALHYFVLPSILHKDRHGVWRSLCRMWPVVAWGA